jgi:predicted transcriptional regulator of viral defense system
MPKTARTRLFEIAVDHYGFVTTEDAADLGIATGELSKLAARGRLRHVAYGIYRFPEMPESAQDPYMLATLWAGPHAVLSHDTTLALYGLCDVNPLKIHVAVPPGYRNRRKNGGAYVLHNEYIDPADIGWWEAIPAVRPAVAIRQAAEGAVPVYLARQAIDNGLDRGILRTQQAAELTRSLGQAS